MTADDRISLIRIKVERAYKHLDDLAEECPAFDPNFHFNMVRLNLDPKAPNDGLDVSPIQLVKDSIPAVAGDVVHNLRSALDHLAFHLVCVGTAAGESRTERWQSIQFPIFHTPNSYKEGKVRKVQGMRREAIEAIDALQPYKGGNNALWRLHQLDIVDKHRAILSMGNDSLLRGAGFGIFLYEEEPVFTEIGRLEAQQEMNLASAEPLIQAEIIESNALLPTLHQLAKVVDNLIPRFQPLLG